MPDMATERRLLIWSGRDAADEAAVRQRLREALTGIPPERFATFPTVFPPAAPAGPVRAAVVTDAEGAAAAVDRAVAAGGDPAGTVAAPRPVVLLLPGQGSQHAAMAAGLYEREPVFTAAVDAVLDLWGGFGEQVRADWLGDRPVIGIDDVRRAQPLLFAVDYALAQLVLSWGIRPVAMLGHSAGEVVAATLAGVFTLPEAARLVEDRVRHAVDIPAGGMLAVAAEAEKLRAYLTGDVAIAAVNARRQTMLAGSVAPLGRVEKRLRAAELTVVTVPATSPFHCPAMAPAAAAAERAFAGIRPRPPVRTVYSGYTGDLMRAEDAMAARFWCRQLTDTVYFGPALDRLLAACGDVILVEAGPSQTLTSFARRHPAVGRGGGSVAVPMLPARAQGPLADRAAVRAVTARLWTEGHDLSLECSGGV
jgi:acyl transferase domain-containing protein